MTTKTTPIFRTMDENHQRFTSDPDYVKGLKSVDHKRLAAATEGLKEKIATLLNYYVFMRSMKSMKLIRGSLSEAAEKDLVARGKETVALFKDVSARFGEIGKAVAASGLDKALNRHMKALCENLPHNPKVLPLLQEIREMGINQGEVSCAFEELKKENYNLLKYRGADGTFAGFVRLVESLNEPLQAEQKMIEQFGLPTVEGAMPTSTSTAAVIGVVVVVGIIICIITVFYA